ncbi:tRNA (guanine(37)-N1)-methyltransferase [Drosophila pseudoobscura]|uniref:tRNA (guanine(37)-N1)-methyltransferase n=1 Tax=Drosophila pseudoobscura pseudoobscura TaxID=46245 RepID=A0A6I8V0J4_DROPS|nr:tRNA (guanine(37)-N1)-methyltransferase [Drosophila pseudoobscura]
MIFVPRLEVPKITIISTRLRHYFRNMNCSELLPPASVRGMRELQRAEFQKRVQVPQLRVPEQQVQRVIPLVKKFLLKMEHMHPVRAVDKSREILLHPMPIKAWESLPTEDLQKQQVTQENFSFVELELNYENWSANEILKSVLPEEEEGMTSYSRIGHIVHLNLRDHLLPYKQLIGEVLRDKLPNCRTVVNKASSIDNTYRNFQLELICGEAEYQVETKENGIPFEFDFSKVYWNPRLSTEHERIVKLLQPGDVLYDVFAGVGPFSVPAAKKRCHVLANDLNPVSFHWLQHNAKRNKCLSNIKMSNKDGREFILKELRADLLQRLRLTDTSSYATHITMNLPAMAVEFLDAFRGLYTDNELADISDAVVFPTVHVYSFAKGENTKALVRAQVEQNLASTLDEKQLQGISFVRNVAPNKDMYRVSFKLTRHLLTTPKEAEANNVRKRCAEDEKVDPEVAATKVKCV